MLSAVVEHFVTETFDGERTPSDEKLASLFQSLPDEIVRELKDVGKQIRSDLFEPFFGVGDPEVFRAKWDQWIGYLRPMFDRFMVALVKIATIRPDLLTLSRDIVLEKAKTVQEIVGEPLAVTFVVSNQTAIAADLRRLENFQEFLRRAPSVPQSEGERYVRAAISFMVATFLALSAVERHKPDKPLAAHLRFAILQAKRASAVYFCTTDRILRG